MDVRRPLKIAFVDFDGTLADLVIDYDEVRHKARHLLKRHGLESAGGLYSMIALTARKHPKLIPSLLRLLTAYEQRGVRRSEIRSGALTLLRWLRKSNVIVYVVTVNHSLVVRRALRRHRLLGYVNGIKGRKDTLWGLRSLKPNASVIKTLIKKHRASPRSTIVIGDAMNDVEVARRASIGAYIVSSLPSSRNRYTPIKSLTILPKLLRHDFAINSRSNGRPRAIL